MTNTAKDRAERLLAATRTVDTPDDKAQAEKARAAHTARLREMRLARDAAIRKEAAEKEKGATRAPRLPQAHRRAS